MQRFVPALSVASDNWHHHFPKFHEADNRTRQEWDFDDDTGTLGIPNSSEATHSFAGAGNYTVTVSLYAAQAGTLVETATLDVTVAAGQPDQAARLLQAMQAAGFRVSGQRRPVTRRE